MILKFKILSIDVWPCFTDACFTHRTIDEAHLTWSVILKSTYIIISFICFFTFQILKFCLRAVQVSDAVVHFPWWSYQMETISALLALCAGNSPVTGEFQTQRPVTRSFDVFFDLRLNKRLSIQSRYRWLKMPSRSLWRHCNGWRNDWVEVMGAIRIHSTRSFALVIIIGISYRASFDSVDQYLIIISINSF